MKKIILTVATVLTFGLANAQDVKFGVKGGLNLSTIKTTFPGQSGESDNKMLVGFNVGGFAEIGLSDKLSFQPELLFSLEGSKFEEKESGSFGSTTYTETTTANTRTSYLNVPLLLKFKATEQLFFVAGPQVGFLLSAKNDYESKYTETTGGVTTTDNDSMSGVDVKDTFKSMSYALALGAGYFFTDNLFADVRYNLGLSNDAEPVTVNFGAGNVTYEPVAKASTIQFSLGYRF